jgi:hypothetical protein
MQCQKTMHQVAMASTGHDCCSRTMPICQAVALAGLPPACPPSHVTASADAIFYSSSCAVAKRWCHVCCELLVETMT